MNPESLFGSALGIAPPWTVENVEFSKKAKRLDIKIGFRRAATFPCPVCGTAAPVHDTSEKNSRHLNTKASMANQGMDFLICGRFSLVTTPEELARQFDLRRQVTVSPRYNSEQLT